MKTLFLSLLLFGGLTLVAQNGNLTVIGNNKGVPAQMSFSELQQVFMGKRAAWSSGEKVLIALMKLNTTAGTATSSKVYKMSADEVTKHCLTLSIKGVVEAPVFFNSAAELQQFVSANPGAIGIVDTGVLNPNIKTVLIDGKKNL